MRTVFLILIATMIMMPLMGNSLTYTKLNTSEMKISFQLPEYNTTRETSEGKELQKLRVTTTSEENWQENFSGVPQLDKWIYIPDGYDANVTLENPATGTKSNYLCDTEQTDKDIAGWLDVSQPIVFRGNRILSICIKPFKYDSSTKQLTTLNSADIRVHLVPSNTYIRNERLYTPATVEMLKAICINRDDIRESNQGPGSMVIFYNGVALANYIQPLVDWKHQKGYDVRMVNTTTIGNNTNAIKNYLQTGYNTWTNPPEYVLIMGRGTSGTYYVPPFNDNFSQPWNTHGDYQYTLLEGGDLVPDAYVGRLTFSSTDELQMAVTKIINYETMQDMSPSTWLNKSFLLGDPYQSGESCITTMYYVKQLLQSYNPTATITETYSGSFPNQISAAIDSGVGTYWYRGHGEFSGWSNSDTAELSNAGKLPFISYVTCFSGNFGNSSTSISQAEKFMRVGTPSIPLGAIGVIGASCETHTCLNNIMTGGFAYGTYVDEISQCGPVLVRGKLALMANYPQNPADYIGQNFLSINLFGDPSLDIMLKPVEDMVITAPAQLYSTGGNVSVRVTYTDSMPVSNAWVCFTKGASELFVSGYTDENGMIVLNYGALSAGSATLTVTKPQHRPYQLNLNVSMSLPTFTMQNITALNQCYAGSNISFPITITNNSAATLYNVTGSILIQNQYITLPAADATFGNISAGATATSETNIQMSIDSGIAKGDNIYMTLHISYVGGSFDIPIQCVENGPDFKVETAAFTNNALNHGTNHLTLTLLNDSQAAITGLQSTLESTNPFLIIQNPDVTLGSIAANATFSIPGSYTIQIADSLLEGMNVRLNLRLFNTSGFVQMLAIDKKVGSESADDITGPDTYGYICYGPGDDGYKPYNWIEIDPNSGGTGINLNFTDTDTEGSGDYSSISLPFQFRFYGKTYSQLTVCSNGIVMPGSQGSIEWMNWAIPGPMVPRPIIAPFWDDLLTDANSRVLYKYDVALHAEIIQWQNLKNKYSPSLRETFQAILYDPSIQTTPTGDSQMLFQYKVFNNIDGGNYEMDYVDHGQYATVGIGDHTGLVGLQYTFNNQYPATAQLLSNQSTLFFTTLPNYFADPNPVLLNCVMNEVTGNGNGQVDFGEQFNLSMIIKNTGQGSFSASLATLSSTDPNVTILQNQGNLQALYNNQTATISPAFGVLISQACPNLHIIRFNLHLQNSTGGFDIPYEMVVHAWQFNYSDVVITDNNNNLPEQGETVQISFNLSNVSLLSAQNIIVTLNQPAGVTVNPASQTINLAALTSQSLSFQVTLGNSISQGSVIALGPHVTVGSVYDSLMTMSLLVGVPEVNLNTGFEDENIGAVISYLFNTTISPAQYIHNTGMEAVMSFPNNYPASYIVSYPISTNDLLNTRVKFTWFNANTNADISLQVLYSNQLNFQSVWNSSAITTTPQTTTFDLNSIPASCEYIYFLLLAQRFGNDATPIILDDLSILSVHHAPGFIAGHVDLDLNPELVSQVNLVQRYSSTVYHPDVNGDFLMPAYQGQNVVYATMEGYIYPADSLVVTVVSGLTSDNNQISMQKLCGPMNLEYTMSGNTITLNWDLEGQDTIFKAKDGSENQDRFMVPDFYRVWFKCNSINFQATTTTQSLNRLLSMTGNYQIYVCGIYLIDGEEVQSDSSNVLTFHFTPNQEDLNVPVVFGLNQNSPNPFNPTTQISFSLPEKSITSLNIYNLKGQLVKTLIDKEYSKGNHTIVWNGNDNNDIPVSSGVYYYRLKWKNKELTRKMVMLK